jgi:hypothetical protein
MLRTILCSLLFAALGRAGVTAVHATERSDVLDGKGTGPAGPYERIAGRVYFTIDPNLKQNQTICDVHLAPVNESGQIEFSADLYVLKPRDSARGNGTVLFEVSNRGGKLLLGRFDRARDARDPRTNEEFGDLYLLEQGYTLVWLGWQFDVPDAENQLRLYAPIAHDAHGSISGVVRAEFTPETKTVHMPLADRNHRPYAALDSPAAQLTVREWLGGARKEIPRNAWHFNEQRTAIEMPSGFQPGSIYSLVYRAADPPLAGLGMAAIRDFVSFLRYGGPETLLGDQQQYIKHSIAFGISQSGRFLRTFLYFGLNEDEKGRKVFDGVWADVAGGGRGSFNQRFAQPSRVTDGLGDLFPFTDLPAADPETKVTAGLLDRVQAAGVTPKIFYTDTSHEYWGRDAALIHITPDGRADAPLAKDTRIYFIAGAQHGPSALPQRRFTQYLSNPNDFRPLHRALLANLTAWVKEGKEPPASRYPRLKSAELVPPARVLFLKMPGVALPVHPLQAQRPDFGPEFTAKGVVSREPPALGKPFPVLVPQVDADGIDVGGIRMPEVAVPLGTFTGWNLRSAEVGAPAEMYSLTGAWMPFSATKAGREQTHDRRPSIEERYRNKEDYLQKVDAAARELIATGLLLDRDTGAIRDHAARLWDYALGQQ